MVNITTTSVIEGGEEHNMYGWNEQEYREHSYHYYQRRPIVVMAKPLTAMEAPMNIVTSWDEELQATEAGYMVVFNPTEGEENTALWYITDRHPIQYDIFADTYALWPGKLADLTPEQHNLVQQGCIPYIKIVGVWAKVVNVPTQIRGLEHWNNSVDVPMGHVIAVGIEGEPYNMPFSSFHMRYVTEGTPMEHVTEMLLNDEE